MFPKGTLVCFPLMPMQKDPDIFPEPHRFDGLRFYKMRDEELKTGIEPYIGRWARALLNIGIVSNCDNKSRIENRMAYVSQPVPILAM